jgi:hypothetical protein
MLFSHLADAFKATYGEFSKECQHIWVQTKNLFIGGQSKKNIGIL